MKVANQIKGYVSNDFKVTTNDKGKDVGNISVVEYVDKEKKWNVVQTTSIKRIKAMKDLKPGTYVKFEGSLNDDVLMAKTIEALDKGTELVGNVVRVSDLETTDNDKQFVKMTIVEPDGEKVKYTDATIWGKAAEIAAKTIPGDGVSLKGEYKKNEVEKNGEKKVYTNFNVNFIEKVKDVNEKKFVGAVISGDDDKLGVVMDALGKDKSYEMLEDKKAFFQKGFSSHENVNKAVMNFNKKFDEKIDAPDVKDFKFDFEGQKVNYQKKVEESKEITTDKGPSQGINM